MTQVTKTEFYNHFRNLDVTTNHFVNGAWEVRMRHSGAVVAREIERPGIGDEDYKVSEYFIKK